MTRDEVIAMAREAGIPASTGLHAQDLERFAALVAAAEREACAQVCDEVYLAAREHQAQDCAAAIRSRSTP